MPRKYAVEFKSYDNRFWHRSHILWESFKKANEAAESLTKETDIESRVVAL